jgi:hypothetical protein
LRAGDGSDTGRRARERKVCHPIPMSPVRPQACGRCRVSGDHREMTKTVQQFCVRIGSDGVRSTSVDDGEGSELGGTLTRRINSSMHLPLSGWGQCPLIENDLVSSVEASGVELVWRTHLGSNDSKLDQIRKVSPSLSLLSST